MGKEIIFILIALMLHGCASFVPQDIEPGLEKNKHYKRDMIISEGNLSASGVIVLPKKDSYQIKVKAKGELDLFTMESCHRVESIENAWEKLGIKPKGWFKRKSKNEIVTEYKPVQGIETGDLACPLRLAAYEKTNKRHSWGFIDFRDDSMKLEMTMKCAGVFSMERGVSVCQSKTGTLQEIQFKKKVYSSKNGTCPELITSDRKTFRFKIQSGECLYRFREDSREGHSLRLTTLGFDGILIREK